LGSARVELGFDPFRLDLAADRSWSNPDLRVRSRHIG
jgi:hypothetical protein